MNKQELESVVKALPEEIKQAILKERNTEKMSKLAKSRWKDTTPEERRAYAMMLVEARNKTPKV